VNTRELSQAIAWRLPGLTQAEVRDVIDVLVDVVREELMEVDHSVHIQGLGRLHVEHHLLRLSGIVRQQKPFRTHTMRLYFRFVATNEFQQTVRQALLRDQE